MLVDRDVVDLSFHRVMQLHHRAVSREQLCRFEGYLAEIFAACGLNLNTPDTEETPRRFLQALFEATEGSDGEPKLLKVFDPECRVGQVIEGPIPFFALCEHHALPFFGHAHIGYPRINPSWAFPSSPASCASLLSVLRSRNGWGSRWCMRCSSRTGSPSISKPTISVSRCGRPGYEPSDPDDGVAGRL